MRSRWMIWGVAVALIAAACGSDDAETVTAPVAAEAGAAVSDASVAAAGDMPDLDMVSVHTGETVNLQSLVSGDAPLLLWFWAPH